VGIFIWIITYANITIPSFQSLDLNVISFE